MLFAQVNQLWFSLPLIVSVSLVYAATRHEDMSSILRHAARFGTWIVVFLLGLGVILWWLGRGL
jgi:spore maturation protein SpmA